MTGGKLKPSSRPTGMQRKSSIEGLTYAQKVELCDSEVILFVGSNYSKPWLVSESEEEDDFHSPKSSPSQPLEDEENDSYYSASPESLPTSSESEEESSSIEEAAVPHTDEETDSSAENSPTRRRVQVLAKEEAHQLAKMAKKMYLFNRPHEHGFTNILFKFVEYVVQPVEVASQTYAAKGLPCFLSESWSWFLVDGHIKNLYFTIQKEDIREPFRLTGLLEPVPLVQEMEEEELEFMFLKTLEDTGQRRIRRNICRLDELSRFRLCSGVYAAVDQIQEQESPIRNWNFTEEKYADDCIKDAVLHFSYIDSEDKRTQVQFDLLLCIVNSDLPQHQFYLALDSFDRDAVYVVVLEPYESQRSHFVLYLRLTEVPCLKMLRFTALVEDFQPRVELIVDRPRPKLLRGKTGIQKPSLKKLLSSISFSSNDGAK